MGKEGKIEKGEENPIKDLYEMSEKFVKERGEKLETLKQVLKEKGLSKEEIEARIEEERGTVQELTDIDAKIEKEKGKA